MQSRLKVTSKGQLTLRKEALTHLGIRPGDTVIVQATEPGRIEIRGGPHQSIESFFGGE